MSEEVLEEMHHPQLLWAILKVLCSALRRDRKFLDQLCCFIPENRVDFAEILPPGQSKVKSDFVLS